MPPSDRLPISGAEIAYRRWGARGAPAAILLHGLSGFSYDWEAVAAALDGRFDAIAPDLRGFGESTRAAGGAYGLADFAADVDALADGVGFGDFTLVGHSLGGRIALYYAATRPGRVRELVLVDAVPEMNPDGSRVVRERLANAPVAFPTFEAAVAAFAPQFPMLDDAALRARLGEYLATNPDGSVAPKRDPAFTTAMPGAYAPPPDASGVSFWELTARVRCNVLLIRGTRSTMVTPELAARLAAHNPSVQITELDSSHNVPAERPAELAALIGTERMAHADHR